MKNKLIFLAGSLLALQVQAASIEVPMHMATEKGVGDSVGSVMITETKYGLLFTPHLKGLAPAGMRGFHIHENASCDPAKKEGVSVAALGAGGHLDPHETGKHLGPYEEGHLGDIPPLYVDEKGESTYPVLAPRIKTLADIQKRALMIHVGGDNNSDHPMPLGGGGNRFACGIIK